MSLLGVTGATGHLGRLTVEALLANGVSPSDIVAIVRDPARATDLSDRGVQVRRGDYSDAESLAEAVTGIENLLLVSGNEMGQRVSQHAAVIDAAKTAGVTRVVYTSAPKAEDTQLILAPEHLATEELLKASGLKYTILRNNWYFENYLGQLAQYLQYGVILNATDGHHVAAAARADYAAAAAVVLTGEGHDNKTYELAGHGFTMAELAAKITEITGTTVVAKEVSPAELIAALEGAGLDNGTATFVTALDESAARDELDGDPAELIALLGRELTPLADAIRAAQ